MRWSLVNMVLALPAQQHLTQQKSADEGGESEKN
jgi:hypothetical protein